MISKELEYRFAEFRADADGIAGVVLPYGRQAKIGNFTEEFRAGAFGRLDDMVLNLQHQRAKPVAQTGAGLDLNGEPAELRAAIKLPDTVYGREARELVDAGILRLLRRVPRDAGPMAGQSSDCPRRDAVRRRAGGPARVHGRADRTCDQVHRGGGQGTHRPVRARTGGRRQCAGPARHGPLHPDFRQR